MDQTEYQNMVASQLAAQSRSLRAAPAPAFAPAPARQSALADLLRGARLAMGNSHPDSTRQHAAVAGEIRWSDPLVPLLNNESRAFSVADMARPTAGTFGASVLQHSVVARLGAKVITMPDAVPVGADDLDAYQVRPKSYKIVTKADFQPVAHLADVVPSALPVLEGEFASDWAEASDAFAVTISRADQKRLPEGELDTIIQQALIRGYAALIDRRLLQHVAALTLPAFSLAAVAAHGLSFGEVRAAIGSAAAGAVVDPMGQLRASGVPGELTNEFAATLAGAWYRAAVAIEPNARVVVDRRSIMGDLTLQCFVTVCPVVADENAFWSVAA